jgi:hypothetical protein
MTNGHLLDFYYNLCNLGHLTGVKLSYAITINKKKLIDEVISLEAGLNDYHKERLKINKQYAKIINGRPVIINNIYQIDESRLAEYDEAMCSLKNKYKKELEEHERLMKEENKLTIHKIKLSDINPKCSIEPETGEAKDITQRELEMLFPMLYEEDK